MVEFNYDNYGGQVTLPLPLPDMKMMPKSLQLIASKVPEYMKPAVMNSCFTALGAHVSNYRYRAINGRYYEPAFMHVTVGRMSAGKGNINAPIEVINMDIKAASDEARAKLVDWANKEKKRAANEEGHDEPIVCIQIPLNNLTEQALIKRLEGCEKNGNKVMFMSSDEIDILKQIKGQNITLSTLIRLMFDRAPYGQERATANGITASAHLRMNINTAGTLTSVRKTFANCLLDGTVSRMGFSMMVKPEGTRIFIKPYDDNYVTAINTYVSRLLEMEGDEDIPQIRHYVEGLEMDMLAWIKKQENKDFRMLLEDLLGRVIAQVHGALVLLYYMEGKQWTKQMQYYGDWRAMYMLTCLNEVIGDMMVRATNDLAYNVVELRHSSTSDILYSLKNEFTTKEFKAMRRERGEGDNVSSLLVQWCTRGFIARVPNKRGYYKKLGQFITYDNLAPSISNDKIEEAEKALDEEIDNILNDL